MSGRQRKAIGGKRQRSGAGGQHPATFAIPGGQAFVDAFNEGIEQQQAGRPREALAAFRRALALNPHNAALLSNLGVVLANLGEHEEAVRFYRQGIKIEPEASYIQSNLADALMKLSRYDEAVAVATRACSLAPGNYEALNNLGSSLFELGRFDEAAVALRRSLDINPENPNALGNLGGVLRDMGKLDDAIPYLRRATELAPQQAVARKNLGLALMQRGEYREGWPEYGWRWLADGRAPRNYDKPLWQGEPLDGRTLLLYTEQGLGDALQFVRFVPVLAAQGARVILEVHPQLRALMCSLKGAAEIIPLWSQTPPFDTFLPIMDVPGVTGMTVDTIPCPIPYLAAAPERVTAWRERLGDGGFKVGVVSQGYNDTPRKRARTAPLPAFAPLAEIEGVRLISLQKPADAQADPYTERLGLETFGPDFDAGPDAFMDTAAVIENLDLVVTIDTSVAHLAGAMGKAVWIALPLVPDWRWGNDGAECPWYPNARLFRQRIAGDWETVFAEIAGELRALVGRSTFPPAPPRARPVVVAPEPPLAPATTLTPISDHEFSRLAAFVANIPWGGAPELAVEPHTSITTTTIDSLAAQGLLPSGARVLDIGCGHGLALEQFGKLGLKAIGITSAADAEICRAKGFDARAMDQNAMDFPDASFDVLWCRQVLQRSPVPLFTLFEYRRVTCPGGLVYVDVPAPDTELHHEVNPAYPSVLPLSSWLSLFARAGFTREGAAAIGVGDGGKADTHWSFQLRRAS